jgi:hypothetical protein
MTEKPDGSLQVAPTEVITVVVTKKFASFAATFTPLKTVGLAGVGASWDGEAASPDGLTVTNTFTAPPTPGVTVIATIIFDFKPDSSGAFIAGDKYDLRVTGSQGGAATPTSIFPPPITAQTLIFVVG